MAKHLPAKPEDATGEDLPMSNAGHAGGDYGIPVSDASLKRGYIEHGASIEALNRGMQYTENANGDSIPFDNLGASRGGVCGRPQGWER